VAALSLSGERTHQQRRLSQQRRKGTYRVHTAEEYKNNISKYKKGESEKMMIFLFFLLMWGAAPLMIEKYYSRLNNRYK